MNLIFVNRRKNYQFKFKLMRTQTFLARIMRLFCLLFFTILGANFYSCARILGVFTVPSKSHTILVYELFKELVASGHEVKMNLKIRKLTIF